MKSILFITFLILTSSQVAFSTEIDLMSITLNKVKHSVKLNEDANGNQSIKVLANKKESYRYIPKPEGASLIANKEVTLKGNPNKFLITQWLLGTKDQRLIVFDFTNLDSPIVLDVYSQSDISFKTNKENLEVSYLTYPNGADEMEISQQVVIWKP